MSRRAGPLHVVRSSVRPPFVAQEARVGTFLIESLESRVLFAGIPQYPDLAPWASQQRGYIYGWSIDTQQIPGRTLLRLSNAAINMGSGPMELTGGAVNPDGSQQVYQRVYSSDGSS